MPGIRLVSVKVQGLSSTGRQGIIDGLKWLVKNARRLRIRVVNMSYGASTPADKTMYPADFLTKEGQLKPGITAKQIEATAECRAITALSKMGITVVVSAGNRAQPTALRPYCWCAEALTVAWVTDLDGLPGGLAGGPAPVWGDNAILWGYDDTSYANSGYAIAGTPGAKRMIGAPGGELYLLLSSQIDQQ